MLHHNIRSFILLSFSIVIASLGSVACNDAAGPIGDDYRNEDVEIFQVDIPVTSFSFTSGVAAISNSSSSANTSMLVGKANDGTEAIGLLSLVNRSERLKNISASSIVRAELQLQTSYYRYGNTDSRRTAFDVVSFEGVFGANAQWHDTLVTKIENGKVLGGFDGNYPDTARVTVPLSNTDIADFLNSYYRVDSSSGSVQTFALKSLALRPSPNVDVITSYFGSSSTISDSIHPHLVITLADTVISLELGVSNWIVQYGPDVPLGAGNVVVAGGAPVRTLMNIALDSIPDEALILRAELTLHIDPLKERFGTLGQNSGVIAYVAGPDPLGSTNRLATSPVGFGPIYLRASRPFNSLSGSYEDYIRIVGIGTTLAQWIRSERGVGSQDKAIANNGLILALSRVTPSLEATTTDQITFFGTDAAEDVRPKLTVTYSLQKER